MSQFDVTPIELLRDVYARLSFSRQTVEHVFAPCCCIVGRYRLVAFLLNSFVQL